MIDNRNFDNLKKILGEDENEQHYNSYNAVRNFFWNVCINDYYEYKILLTRRSYVLYKIFLSIFQKEDSNFTVKGKIYNTHSIPLIKPKSESKILIVDDIIVNGGTINQMLKTILKSNNINNDNIKVWCLLCNAKAASLEDIKPYFGHVIYRNPDCWETFSDKLTKAIISTNIGYISYVNSYLLKGVNLLQLENEFENVVSNNADYFYDYKIQSKIAFECFNNQAIFEKYNVKLCLRMYQNIKDEVLLIPYAFLPALSTNQIEKYCKDLLSELNITKIPLEFCNEIIDENILTLLYKWTIYRVSREALYSIPFIDIHRDQLNDYFECNESYPFEYANNAECGNSTSDISEWCYMPYNVDQEDNDEIKACTRRLNKYLDEFSDISDFEKAFRFYLSEMRQIDGGLARDKKPRSKGLRISDIIYEAKKRFKDISEEKIVSIIISMWDCGKTAYVIEKNDDEACNSYVEGFIRHGEQIYKEYFCLNKDIYSFFYYFFCNTFDDSIIALNNFAKYFDEKYSTKKFSIFVDRLYTRKFYYDLKAISPQSIGADINCISVNPEDDVSVYIQTVYKNK